MTKEEIQAINPDELIKMLSEEQKRKIWKAREIEYIKSDIQSDFWRWGKYEEISPELEQKILDNADFVYDFVQEELANLEDGEYSDIMFRAVECAIEERNLLNNQ